jgi:hypothetical protein
METRAEVKDVLPMVGRVLPALGELALQLPPIVLLRQLEESEQIKVPVVGLDGLDIGNGHDQCRAPSQGRILDAAACGHADEEG